MAPADPRCGGLDRGLRFSLRPIPHRAYVTWPTGPYPQRPAGLTPAVDGTRRASGPSFGHGQPHQPDPGPAGDPDLPDVLRPAGPLPDDPGRRPPHGERSGDPRAVDPSGAADRAPARLDLRLTGGQRGIRRASRAAR